MSRYARRQDATQKPLAAELERAGWLFVDLSTLGRGWPDGVFIKHGRCVWTEFKTPETVKYSKGRQSEARLQKQADIRARLRRAGAEVAVVASLSDLAQFERPA